MSGKGHVSSLCALMLATLLTAGCWAEKKPATWTSATAPEQFERLFWDSVKAKDWKEVRNRLAPTFVSQSSRGAEDKEATLARLQTMDLQQVSIGDIQVQTNGADMVVTYRISMSGSLGGQPLVVEQARMMSVWQQVKRGWIMIAQAALRNDGQQ
jgi:uncharacterized protein DUF4440